MAGERTEIYTWHASTCRPCDAVTGSYRFNPVLESFKPERESVLGRCFFLSKLPLKCLPFADCRTVKGVCYRENVISANPHGPLCFFELFPAQEDVNMSHQRHTGPSGLMVIFAVIWHLESCFPSQDLQMLRGRPSVFLTPAAASLGRVE